MAGKGQTSIPEDLRRSVLALYKPGTMGKRKIAKTLQITVGKVEAILRHEGLQVNDRDLVEIVPALRGAGLSGAAAAAEASKILGRAIGVSSIHNAMVSARIKAELEPIRQSYVEQVQERLRLAEEWGPGRYMVLNDLHIRFHSEACLAQAIAEKGTFDGCIIPGDLVDAMWMSRFRKQGYVSVESEVRAAKGVIERITKRFGRVLYCLGNHEDRLWKSILEMSEGLQRAAGEEGAPALMKTLRGIEDLYWGKYPGVTFHRNWFVQVGKVLVCHADAYSMLQGKTAANVLEHFQNRRQEYRLQEIDTVMEAHLHRHSGPHRHRDVFLWELPCCAPALDYQMAAKATRGQTDTGYSILVVGQDGRMVFNESRSKYLERDIMRS